MESKTDFGTDEAARPLSGSLGELLHYLSPTLAASLEDPETAEAPAWPPDAFAMVAYVLQQSGAYRKALQGWPPKSGWPRGEAMAGWLAKIRGVGNDWRKEWAKGRAPHPVKKWWRQIAKNRDVSIQRVSDERVLYHALLQVMAAADEACELVGAIQAKPGRRSREEPLLPSNDGARRLRARATALLLSSTADSAATLCSPEHIDPWKVRVLPKYHTPQTGVTLRSFSLNLALDTSNEVIPKWHRHVRSIPDPLVASQGPGARLFNILVVPWPDKIGRGQFPALEELTKRTQMPEGFGYFGFDKKADPEGAKRRLEQLYGAAKAEAGRIDLIVLPELALEVEEYEEVQKWAVDQDLFLISGVNEPGKSGHFGRNEVRFELPTSLGSSGLSQPKHHRWQLDRSQIVSYGLGGLLNPEVRWWEGINVDRRALELISMNPKISLCVLICEDLAQQEPVARTVRAIGPNLVIALLMDGPQLSARWPARYATVLASDPGSSVLTITSLGMCQRSVPFGKTPLRTVALWEDSKEGKRELSLGNDEEALVLNLLFESAEEFSADGRSDGGTAVRPVLVGAYGVRGEESPAKEG